MKLMRPVAMLCALGITIGGVTALAAAQGSQEDPLITLSYLESVLRPDLEKKVDAAVAANEAALMEKVNAAVAKAGPATGGAQSAVFAARDLAQGDSFTPGSGREILVVSGALTAVGKLTDTTAGTTVNAGAALEVGHLYITSSDSAGCKATVASGIMSR